MITVTPLSTRTRVHLGDTVVADTTRALELREGSYPPVLYIPREDIAAALLRPSARRSHCPHKGDATYFSIATGPETAVDAAWSYEQPFPAVAAIAGHLAFYPDKLRIETTPS